jgi:hypothetical protein
VNTSIPSLAEFEDACRAHFEFLVRDHGFREDHRAKHPNANPFLVAFVRDDLEVTIEGIHWGDAALVLLRDKIGRTLGPLNLDPEFEPLKRSGRAHVKRAPSQIEDIARQAQLLRVHGASMLKGDTASWEAAIARVEAAKAAYQLRRERGIAMQEAIAAYRREDWREVVRLLGPHEADLPKTLEKKLAHARGRL